MWKARCPRSTDRTISGWLRTKTSLSSPKPTFKIRNTHTCFCRPRLLEQPALGADLTSININSPVAGIIPRHQRNPYGAPLRVEIPRMPGRLMRFRLIPAARTAFLAPYTRRELSAAWVETNVRMAGLPELSPARKSSHKSFDPAGYGPRPAQLHRCGSTRANGDGLPSGRSLDFTRWLLSFQQVPRIGAHR